MGIKNFLAFIIVVTGIGLSTHILRSSNTNKNAPETKEIAETSNSSNELDYQKIIEEETRKTLVAKNKEENTDENLTNALASLYAAEFAKNNDRENLEQGNIKKIELDENALTKIVNQETAKAALFRKSFEKKDIRITTENSKDSVSSYLTNVSKITEKNVSGLENNFIQIVDSWLEQNLKETDDYDKKMSNLLTELLATETPNTLIDFHLELINLWQKKIDVVRAISKSNEDPLKAYLAFSEAGKLLNQSLGLQEKSEILAKAEFGL